MKPIVNSYKRSRRVSIHFVIIRAFKGLTAIFHAPPNEIRPRNGNTPRMNFGLEGNNTQHAGSAHSAQLNVGRTVFSH